MAPRPLFAPVGFPSIQPFRLAARGRNRRLNQNRSMADTFSVVAMIEYSLGPPSESHDLDRAMRASRRGGGNAAQPEPFKAVETSRSDEDAIRSPACGLGGKNAFRVALSDL